MLRTTQSWPLSIRLTTAIAALGTAALLQLPLEQDVPGDPFLVFFVVVICTTLAFGAREGFIVVGLSTLLTPLFFEPGGTFALHHAADIIKIEVYAIVAACSVVAFTRLGDALIDAREKAEDLKRRDDSKSVLLRELAHGVANDFAAVAAFMSLKSMSISNAEAKSVLDEAIEQVKVIGSVHRRLRGGHRAVSLDSRSFLEELCDQLARSIGRGRLVSIECKADSLPLCGDQAVPLGLIVNELVMNALKHAFPMGRPGRIRVCLEARENQFRLSVEDDGVGFAGRTRNNAGMGQDLVRGLARQLEAELDVNTTRNGTSFRLSIPYVSAALTSQSSEMSAESIH